MYCKIKCIYKTDDNTNCHIRIYSIFNDDTRQRRDIETVWQDIVAHEVDVFHTERWKVFTYTVNNNDVITIYRNGQRIHNASKNDFRKALSLDRLSGKEFSDSVNAPSYVRGILDGLYL